MLGKPATAGRYFFLVIVLGAAMAAATIGCSEDDQPTADSSMQEAGKTDAASPDTLKRDAVSPDMLAQDVLQTDAPTSDSGPPYGDGIKNGAEQCDKTDLGGQTCSSLGFAGGTLTCTSKCLLSGCTSKGFVSVTAGTFTMGSPPEEPCRFPNEDQHQVTLTHPFELAVSETTQGDFQTLMGYNPSCFGSNGCGVPGYSCGATPCQGQCADATCPVENIYWHEAAAYCNALSAQRGLDACYSCTGSKDAVTMAAA